MLATTSKTDLLHHLREVGLEAGMDVAVHSRLLSFGRIEGGAETVYHCLLEVLGPEGTLIVPTYTISTSVERPYDPRSTPSENVGVLGEYVRRQAGVIRSASPKHNHAAIGPNAGLLLNTPPTVSLGPGTDFEVMHRAGFHLLLLGCRFGEGCTFLHHMEAVVGVPYRTWKDLPCRVIDAEDGTAHDVECHYYIRVDWGWEEDFDLVERTMAERGLLGRAEAPYGTSFLMALDDLYDYVAVLLTEDPYALVYRVK